MTAAGKLIEMRDSGETVRDHAQDIRGRKAVDQDGEVLGKIAALLVTSEGHTVRMMRIEHGGILGFGSTSSFVPIEAIREIRDDAVTIDQTGTSIKSAPAYNPELVDSEHYIGSIYAYYGYPGLWGYPVIPPAAEPGEE